MLGLLYILLSFVIGWVLCSYAFPELEKTCQTDLKQRSLSLSPYFVLLPAWYTTGTLAMTWATYLLGYLFKSQEEPLFYANLMVLPITLLVSVAAIYFRLYKRREIPQLLSRDYERTWVELLLVILITLLAAVLMWRTFFIQSDKVYIGVTVFSDFSPHLGMIRSFSYGNNFPTSYSHYGGEDIKYHFMFQFMVGNLEYLGLRLDYAFNLPSILSFVFAFFLLYVIAVKITGRTLAGWLACLFFAFRSGKALFTYLASFPNGTKLLEALKSNTGFVADTPNEDWGLWNLNVYCNQRHLAFGLTVFFLVILLFLPHLYRMFDDLKNMHLSRINTEGAKSDKAIFTVINTIKLLLLRKEGWLWEDLRRAIAAGVLLGSLAFFHGAAVIGCLSVLVVMAICSRHRLEYLITAVIVLLLSTLQTGFFIRGSAVSPELFFGFIAENKTFFGVASYLERLLGVLPLVLLVSFCLEEGADRYLMLAFSAPLVFAFTISLTVDVTVNHKYVMMACILLGVFSASLIDRLFRMRGFIYKMVGLLLVVLLTATGIYDFNIVLRRNTKGTAVVLEENHPLTLWVKENSTSQDLFLTDTYAINQLVFGGAMLYEGWTYFPWSAGYNTEYRIGQVKKMYSASSPEELKQLVKLNNIRYIVVDYSIRNNEEVVLNESNIINTYECVYQEGEGEWQLSIYDTAKPKQ